jgi:hypothetical protein
MPLLDVFLTMMWFFLWGLWFFLLFRVIMDIFRSRDLGGWGKAGWLVFTIVLPFLGVLVYLIARGGKMADREFSQAQDGASRAYVRAAAHGNGTADELTKLADLRDHGVISDADYERARKRSSAGRQPDQSTMGRLLRQEAKAARPPPPPLSAAGGYRTPVTTPSGGK